MKFQNKKKINLKTSKNTRFIALEIWVFIFYNEKNFDQVIDEAKNFNKLDKRDKAFVYLLINTSMRRHRQAISGRHNLN